MNPHGSYPAVALLVKGMKHLPQERPQVGRFLVRLLAAASDRISAIDEVLVRSLWEANAWRDLMDLLVAACGGGGPVAEDGDDVGLPTRRQLGVLDLFGNLEPSTFDNADRLVWYCMQGFALGAATDVRPLVANHAAFSIASVAKNIEDPGDAKLYAAAIRRIANDPRVVVRSAIADVGPHLAEHAKSQEVRDAAREGIALVGADDNAQVSVLLARATAAVAAAKPAHAAGDGDDRQAGTSS